MENLKKNPVALGGIAVVALIILFAAAYFFIVKGFSQSPTTQQFKNPQEQIKKIDPSEIGMTLVPRSDNKAIIFEVTKLSGIKSFEYSAEYDANVKDNETGQTAVVPRGVQGTIDIKPTDTGMKREIELGTCSRNVCNYDNVVSGIKFTVKITYTNGKVGAIEQTVNLPGTSSNQ